MTSQSNALVVEDNTQEVNAVFVRPSVIHATRKDTLLQYADQEIVRKVIHGKVHHQ